MLKIHIVKLDETQYWREDIRAVAGKCFGVYLYDPTVRTHLCELTPSYELRRMGTLISGSEAFDALDDDAREAFYESLMRGEHDGSEPVDYMHVRNVERLPVLSSATEPAQGRAELGDFDGDTDEEAMNAAEEYVRGNGYTDT